MSATRNIPNIIKYKKLTTYTFLELHATLKSFKQQKDAATAMGISPSAIGKHLGRFSVNGEQLYYETFIKMSEDQIKAAWPDTFDKFMKPSGSKTTMEHIKVQELFDKLKHCKNIEEGRTKFFVSAKTLRGIFDKYRYNGNALSIAAFAEIDKLPVDKQKEALEEIEKTHIFTKKVRGKPTPALKPDQNTGAIKDKPLSTYTYMQFHRILKNTNNQKEASLQLGCHSTSLAKHLAKFLAKDKSLDYQSFVAMTEDEIKAAWPETFNKHMIPSGDKTKLKHMELLELYKEIKDCRNYEEARCKLGVAKSGLVKHLQQYDDGEELLSLKTLQNISKLPLEEQHDRIAKIEKTRVYKSGRVHAVEENTTKKRKSSAGTEDNRAKKARLAKEKEIIDEVSDHEMSDVETSSSESSYSEASDNETSDNERDDSENVNNNVINTPSISTSKTSNTTAIKIEPGVNSPHRLLKFDEVYDLDFITTLTLSKSPSTVLRFVFTKILLHQFAYLSQISDLCQKPVACLFSLADSDRYYVFSLIYKKKLLIYTPFGDDFLPLHKMLGDIQKIIPNIYVNNSAFLKLDKEQDSEFASPAMVGVDLLLAFANKSLNHIDALMQKLSSLNSPTIKSGLVYHSVNLNDDAMFEALTATSKDDNFNSDEYEKSVCERRLDQVTKYNKIKATPAVTEPLPEAKIYDMLSKKFFTELKVRNSLEFKTIMQSTAPLITNFSAQQTPLQNLSLTGNFSSQNRVSRNENSISTGSQNLPKRP